MILSYKEGKWTPDEVEFLRKNYTLPVDVLSEKLRRSPMAVNIKIHRLRLSLKRNTRTAERVPKNILYEMISSKIEPRYFRPGLDFYHRTGIGQKRFWQLFRGEKNMTRHEYLAIARELGIPLSEGINFFQTELNFD